MKAKALGHKTRGVAGSKEISAAMCCGDKLTLELCFSGCCMLMHVDACCWRSVQPARFTSMCFFLVSRSAPAKQLAKQQPISSVFDWPVMSTLACQLLIHLITLFSGWQMANQFRAKDFKRDLEGDFEPTLTNTVVFELMAAMHAASFLANYDGHPFMQPLSANKPLMYSLIFFVTVIVACATEVLPDLNHSLSLVLSPSPEFQRKILLLVVGDIALSFGTARCISLFALHWRGRSAEQRAHQLGLSNGKGPSEKSK